MLSFLGSSPTLSLWPAHRVEIRKPIIELNTILALLENKHSTGPLKGCKPRALPVELQIAELCGQSELHYVRPL